MSQQQSSDTIHDESRLKEIARLDLISDEVDEILNELAQKAADEFDLPMGMVSIVLDEAQITAGAHGVEGWIAETGGIPNEWSFCSNSVTSGKPFVVEDATKHPKTKDNPLVSNDGIRCYAGVPLETSNGHILGNFCVVGAQNRSFTEEEIEQLRDYADKAVARIEERAAAH